METVKDVFVQYQLGLGSIYEPNEIEAIILLILNDLLKLSNARLKAFPETEIANQHAERLTNILVKLKTGRPVQYILGHTGFYGLPFKVDESVLIPRPETEELVQWIIKTVGKAVKPVKRILDIGTGSGCIAITLKKNLPQIELFAMDISTGALGNATINADLNQVDINFIEADILNFNYTTDVTDFDLIVSNPPYVTQTDKRQMSRNVIDFEPHTALFVPEDDPLLFYNAIAGFAQKRLTKKGLLFFEINESYGKQTIEMLAAKGFRNIELRQDMYGKDRMVKAGI